MVKLKQYSQKQKPKEKSNPPGTKRMNQLEEKIEITNRDLETTHFSILDRIRILEERIKELENEHLKPVRAGD